MRSTLVAVLILGGLFVGCSTNHPDRARDQDHYTGPVTRNDRDSWNRLHHDPVCGMNVNPKQSLTENYEGTTFYFDSDECRRKFHDNPQAYLWDYDRDGRRTQEVR